MVDMAYEWIEEAIVTLRLAPGSTLSELQLSEMTGFGRTPIREAIQRLAREHLIVVLPQRGLL
ncbi:MAG: GntR family transcriptional regulator, partial [Pandoraea sp.]|nr:GntR family transcriptional regulator [Pandoraea sp.]